MSNASVMSSSKDKKRPSVSSKCLLSIRTIVTQNVTANRTSCRSVTQTSTPPPLPLADSAVSSKAKADHVDSTKENSDNDGGEKARKSPILPDTSALSQYRRNVSTEPDTASGGHVPPSVGSTRVVSYEAKSRELPTHVFPLQLSDLEPHSSRTTLTNSTIHSSVIPPLPLNCLIYPFSSATTSLPMHLPSRNSADAATLKQRTTKSPSTNSNDTDPVELSIHRCPPPCDARIDPLLSLKTSASCDDKDQANYDTLRALANSALSSSSKASASDSSKRGQRSHHGKRHSNPMPSQQISPWCPSSAARLPHPLRPNPSPLSFSSPGQTMRSPTGNPTPPRRPFPQFESVRTPAQRSSQKSVPPEFFDCCQTEPAGFRSDAVRPRPSGNRRSLPTTESVLHESEARSSYFVNVAKIREIMANVSKRLTEDNGLQPTTPLVDTHCHFDLVFDRLSIKHNDTKKYFDDYSEYYPPGLSFELAIQVFWRPKHLTEKNWKHRFSTYLDDERVYGACGIHPHWSADWEDTCAHDIERCLEHRKIVAIGEIGLDFGPKNTCSMHQQTRAFEAQLKLAAKWLKPLVIHSRDAFPETFELMKKHLDRDHKIHLHCFTGSMDDVHLFTSYFNEIKFGFTPLITRTTFLHSVIQQLELSQILSETDSPYFVPTELSAHTRCAHPGMVYSVVETIAQLRYRPVADVAMQLRENARQIYGV